MVADLLNQKTGKMEGAAWYALYTRPRAEKKVYQRLLEEGVEAFLPLMKTLRQWSDRRKMVEKPLLSSYVFVKLHPVSFKSVYRVNGFVRFVSFEGKPVPIPQYQIDNLRLLINSDAEIEITTDQFEPGDFVEVTTGTLKGLRGELIRKGGKKRFVVRIDRIEQNIIVSISPAFLKKLEKL